MTIDKQQKPNASSSRARLAVCLCECAGTLTEKLDFAALAASAGQLPGVARVLRCHTLCQPGGSDQLLASLKDQRISRALIAACAPAYYSTALETACSSNNINPHLVGRVNIREHCAWVHPDKTKATQKASRLITSAVDRLRRQLAAASEAIETGQGDET